MSPQLQLARYAGLSFSALFIIVPLFLDGKLTDRTPVEYFAIIFGLGPLAVAKVILGVVDFVHANTLTPLVTTKRQFQILHWAIILGAAALSLQICAVGVILISDQVFVIKCFNRCGTWTHGVLG